MSRPDLRSRLRDFRFWSAVDAEQIADCELAVRMEVPTELRELWLSTGSCEGWLGATFLQVWTPGEVVDFHQRSTIAGDLAGYLVFGCDGAEELFAFDLRHGIGGIAMIPAIIDPS